MLVYQRFMILFDIWPRLVVATYIVRNEFHHLNTPVVTSHASKLSSNLIFETISRK